MSTNSINSFLSTTSSINKKNIVVDNRNCLYPCQQCVTCGTFGIVTSTMEMSTLNSANKEQNKQYTCINKSLCSKYFLNEKKIPEGIEVERALQ